MGSGRRFVIGARVRSNRRAPWTGTIVVTCSDLDPSRGRYVSKNGQPGGPYYLPDGSALVEVTHDRFGRPLRKSLWRVMDIGCLELVDDQSPWPDVFDKSAPDDQPRSL